LLTRQIKAESFSTVEGTVVDRSSSVTKFRVGNYPNLFGVVDLKTRRKRRGQETGAADRNLRSAE
jgi:hypothetical protein